MASSSASEEVTVVVADYVTSSAGGNSPRGYPHTSSFGQQTPIIDTISILNCSSSEAGEEVGVVKDEGTISLNQVLLQEFRGQEVLDEHRVLADQLDRQPLTGHVVSSDPEALRFQYPPVEEILHHSSTSSPPPSSMVASKKKAGAAKTVYREQDRFVPLHNVARIMRHAIPANGKVSKDAKECMQECVSECVSFITSEASDKCIAEKRKTITGDDILFAMATLGFDNYVEPLKLYLQKYREFTRADKVSNTAAESPSNPI